MMHPSLVLLLFLAVGGLTQSPSWRRTSPTVAPFLSSITQYKDVVLMCGQELEVTTPKFSSFHRSSFTPNCARLASGPAGFLTETGNKFMMSTNGRDWNPVNVGVPSSQQVYVYGHESRYFVCGESFPKGIWEIQCATSENLKEWKHSEILRAESKYEYFQLHSNDTAVVAQAAYTPDNRTWHTDGFQLNSDTLKWDTLYHSVHKGFPTTQMPRLILGYDGGWLAGSYDEKLGVESLVWTDNFKDYKKGLIPLGVLKDIGGAWSACAMGDSLAVYSLGYAHRFTHSSTPLKPASWKEVSIPHYPYTTEDWNLRCFSNGLIVNNNNGAVLHTELPSLDKFKQIYNGVVGSGVTVVSNGETVYIPTMAGDTWESVDNGALWKPIPVQRDVSQGAVRTYKMGTKTMFVGSNYSHIFTTEDWRHFVVNKLPYERSTNGAHGIVGHTLFKNKLIVVWQNGYGNSRKNFITETAWPLKMTSKWTTRYTVTKFPSYRAGLFEIAASDEVAWATGTAMTVYSTDGVHWKEVTFLGEYDDTEGLAAGGGNVFSIFRRYDKNFTSSYAAYKMEANGMVQQEHAFGTNDYPSYRSSLQYDNDLKVFIFAWENGDIGYTVDEFKTVNRTSIANHPSFDAATVTTTKTHIIVGYCEGAYNQNFVYTTPKESLLQN